MIKAETFVPVYINICIKKLNIKIKSSIEYKKRFILTICFGIMQKYRVNMSLFIL